VSIDILEERIIRLEREKQKLQVQLSQSRSEIEDLGKENQDLVALLDQARD
jgi:prefoldin subunit 5